jgi:hypothetical protein
MSNMVCNAFQEAGTNFSRIKLATCSLLGGRTKNIDSNFAPPPPPPPPLKNRVEDGARVAIVFITTGLLPVPESNVPNVNKRAAMDAPPRANRSAFCQTPEEAAVPRERARFRNKDADE